MLVGPELAGGADAGLDFVDDHEHVVAFGDVAQALEEFGGRVVVAAFGLDGLDDDGGDGVVVGRDDFFGFREAALDFGFVLRCVIFEGVFEHGEGRLGPVEGGDVEFVDGFAAGGG